MPTIHPTAILTGEITLADDVEIGPYCVLTGNITLGQGVKLIAHVNLQGPLTIGAGTRVYPNASLGFEAQDYKFTPGMPTGGVVIGERCLVRECVTVHAATKPDIPTRVGDGVFLMVNAHVGHDAIVCDEVILGNNSALAGHSEVHFKAMMTAGSMVHQFSRIGRQALISGCTIILGEVPPFCIAAERNMVVGLNLIGMRRSGMALEEINAVREAFRKVLRVNPPRGEMLEMLAERAKSSQAVTEMYDFIRTTKRPLSKTVRKAGTEMVGA